MSDKEHSDWILLSWRTIYGTSSCRGWHFDKVEASEIPVWKVCSSSIDFRNKKGHINKLLINLDRSVFTVKYQTSALLYWPRYVKMPNMGPSVHLCRFLLFRMIKFTLWMFFVAHFSKAKKFVFKWFFRILSFFLFTGH